ncbi:FUSC family protein [Xanthobacter sediminis]
MHVAQRPRIEDDPLFPVRLAAGASLSFIAALWMETPFPMLVPIITVNLMGGMRHAFNPQTGIGAPIALLVMICAVAFLLDLAMPLPLVMMFLLFGIFTLAQLLILKTGSHAGMLLTIVSALLGFMRLESSHFMINIRDSLYQAALCALVLVPLLYALLPTASREVEEEHLEAAPGGYYIRRAAIRASVLCFVIFWLEFALHPSNMVFMIVTIFVLCFPTEERRWAEAFERVVATLIGGALTLTVLGLFNLAAHLPVLAGLIFLSGLFMGNRMMNGRFPPMVYQFSLVTLVGLLATSLTTGEPFDATAKRMILSFCAAISAAFLTALLEVIFVPHPIEGRTAPFAARRRSAGKPSRS